MACKIIVGKGLEYGGAEVGKKQRAVLVARSARLGKCRAGFAQAER